MASVELNNVAKIFHPKKGEEIYAVANLNLTVADKELVALVGPSGCGKTTVLRLIAGLEKPSAGSLAIDGRSMEGVPAPDRDVAMVFQRDALYPHMTMFQNLAFGLQLRNVPKPEVETRVKAMAGLLGLAALLERYPRELSGGQRQRVALGRALVRDPKVVLLDEPFSNLDTPLRMQMRLALSEMHARLGATILHVTHDQAEAMTLGQRVAVMREGTIQQVGTPLALYQQPANLFVAGFIGSPPMNLFRGHVVPGGDGFVFQEHNPAGAARGLRLELPLPPERGARLSKFAEGNIVLGLRAEDIHLADGASGGPVASTCVELVERLGLETRLHFGTGAHRFVARLYSTNAFNVGECVPLRFDLTKAFFFNPVSEAPIG